MSRRPALVVTPRPPWPLDDGGRVGLWQSVVSLAGEFDVTLVSLVHPGRETTPPPELAKLGVSTVLVPHRPPAAPIAALQALTGPWPHTLARYRSAALERTLRQLVKERRPAFAFVNHLHLATAVGALAGTATILRQHNVEHLWLERYAESVRNPIARGYVREQARRMRVAEARLCEAFDLVAAIQEREAQALRALAPRARVEVIPMGIDYSRFLPHAPASPPVVLLTGAFGWAPNAEGARAFVSNGWPRVAARVPGARLRVVGKDLSLDLEHSIRAAGGEPVGYVDSITPEYAVATVLVVPLWVGAGVRVKIVEALGAGPVVVSTPLGAEGLGLERDRHFVEAGTPEELGEAVARLLLAPELARAIADEGRRFAQERFSISAVSRRTIELVERVLETRASGARA